MSIFKKFVAPVQARILDKHMCPACTRNLDKQRKRDAITVETELVFCICGRAYVFNKPQRRYRRALPNEVRAMYTLPKPSYEEN